jgi:hypothetical protein
MYKKIPDPSILLLFAAFALIGVFDIGFIVLDFMPLGESSRELGELIVSIRIFPIALLLVSIKMLYTYITKYLNGTSKK